MSATSFASIFDRPDAEYAEKIRRNTWGHLQAEPRTVHKGTILFTCAEDGTYVVIRSNFPTLDGGPWEYEAMCDFAADRAKDRGVVYLFSGECRIKKNGDYRFVGPSKKVM